MSLCRLAEEVEGFGHQGRAIALEFLCDSNTRRGIMEVYWSLSVRENHEPT